MHRYYAECKKRASLVPAAAVIPALRAYIKVVAFKTPVVEIAWSRCPTRGDRKKKGRERGKREMQYYACSSALRKEEQGGRGKEKACALVLMSAFKFSLKNLFSFLRLRGVVGVCARHFFCPASFLF